MNELKGFQNVPGVPDGWKLLEFRKAVSGDCVIDTRGLVMTWSGGESVYVYPIVRKIEKSKQYRPFANAEEFVPYRDRWWKFKTFSLDLDPNELMTNPPAAYNHRGFSGCTWQQAFNGRVFDDGTPFGLEVSE
jgi:hypothetical protein